MTNVITIVVEIEANFCGQARTDYVEIDVSGLTSQAEIEKACDDAAHDAFFNACNYGWRFQK